ncbi:MAG: ribokinase [Anaerolineae bacterium]|jgi:ribokinase
MSAKITVVGSLNMDLVARAARLPQPGETILGHDFRTVPGGKGANQAVAAARLGARVTMVGRVGDDAFGDQLIENLAASGVDHSLVGRDAQAATGVALIVVDDGGQNSIVVAPGANGRLTPSDVEAAEAAIAGSDALLLQLESPLESVVRAAEMAHAHGVRVILNPAPARALPASLLSRVEVLIPNESEAALLASMPAGDRAEATAAALALQKRGVGQVVVTLGARGALLAGGEGVTHFAAFAVTPVDTTAAGDAFVGSFAVALAEGRSPAGAVRRGNAAGALAASKPGAQPSLPTRQELEALVGQ